VTKHSGHEEMFMRKYSHLTGAITLFTSFQHFKADVFIYFCVFGVGQLNTR